MSGVDGELGFDVSTTFAKCVGTATLGGLPMTSCFCFNDLSDILESTMRVTYDEVLAITVWLRQVQWDCEDVDVRERARESSAPFFDICPVVPVEACADLRRDVRQVERLIHSLLGQFCIRCWYPMKREACEKVSPRFVQMKHGVHVPTIIA